VNLVRLESVKDNSTLIDVYEAGRRLSHAAAEVQAHSLSEVPLTSEVWKPQSKREILYRLVKNLAASAEDWPRPRANGNASAVAPAPATTARAHPWDTAPIIASTA